MEENQENGLIYPRICQECVQSLDLFTRYSCSNYRIVGDYVYCKKHKHPMMFVSAMGCPAFVPSEAIHVTTEELEGE